MMLSLSLTWLPMKMSATIGDDGDECKDEGVFREALAVFAAQCCSTRPTSRRESDHGLPPFP